MHTHSIAQNFIPGLVTGMQQANKKHSKIKLVNKRC